MTNYRDLLAWQKSRAFVKAIYQATASFPKTETFGLSLQLRRAAVSIPSNIAEGYGRRGGPDLLRFLYIARGSLLELETQILVAGDLEFLTESDLLLEGAAEVGRLLNGLIGYHTGRENPLTPDT